MELGEPRGFLSTPRYPLDYKGKLERSWVLRVSPSRMATFTDENLSLPEPHLRRDSVLTIYEESHRERRMSDIGADVLDLAETMVASADGLVYEPVMFDLSPQQKEWQRMLQLIQSRLQEEHSLQDVLFKRQFHIPEVMHIWQHLSTMTVPFTDGHTDNHLPLLENSTH
ncbi:Endoplasmic reticulum-Golgi intermediate compartment protein 2 [Myotis davidii]|uniref:Endoplasmic reticulum-Golgi intermediate compartment protein 2 n=1 Tax=Myotis davidii TaxID=225400 RepID=L5LHC2_MYODS|nr:Endoplasmic reticulum-Golgi intermediate compartment protein 2 [Myotis davidii]